MEDLIQVALLAFRNARYRDAVELLLQVVDAEPLNWLAKLYLGMSYQRMERLADAQRLFKIMKAECIDLQIRSKAEAALAQVEAEMQKRFALTEGKEEEGGAAGKVKAMGSR